jgi:hypothetical protein
VHRNNKQLSVIVENKFGKKILWKDLYIYTIIGVPMRNNPVIIIVIFIVRFRVAHLFKFLCCGFCFVCVRLVFCTQYFLCLLIFHSRQCRRFSLTFFDIIIILLFICTVTIENCYFVSRRFVSLDDSQKSLRYQRSNQKQ